MYISHLFKWSLLCCVATFFGYAIAAVPFDFKPPEVIMEKKLAIEFQNTNLRDAIRMLAKFLDLNIILSPKVNGIVSLHLRDARPNDVLDLLLSAHGLAKWQVDRIWFIAPQDELIKRRQEELKWKEVVVDALPLQMYVWQIKFAKADDIAHVLNDEHASLISKRGKIRVDARTNLLCVQDTHENIKMIGRLINRLDVPVKQILIEARLASVDNDFERELGINFSLRSSVGLHEEEAPANHEGRYALAVAKLANGSWLDVKLSALEKAGHAELISSPSLFTANQLQASIEAGEEVPYQEVSTQGGTAVAFKKAVLGLKVTPHVLPGNKVLLQLQINQDRPSNRMVLGMPTISTRQIITSVLVKNGQTLVLGGIYEINQEKGEQGLPFIHRLPIIGLLFKERVLRQNKRQLLIFVTPKIIA